MSLTLYGCVGHSCTNLPTCLMSHAPMLFLKAMSKNYINHIDTYNDNSKSITINGTSVNINDLVRSFMAEDVEPVEEHTQPAKTPKDIWGIPQKGKYNQVREYIEERKKGDPEFREFYKGHSLREICTYLTNEFGWFVDEHSLGANINRNR